MTTAASIVFAYLHDHYSATGLPCFEAADAELGGSAHR